MYRTYQLTEKEKDKFVKSMWDGDTISYSVFDTKEEYEAEMERLRKIEEEAKQRKEEYYKSIGLDVWKSIHIWY